MVIVHPIWEKAKKTMKFVWRHFVTLSVLGILLSVFIEGPVNWKNAFFMISTAILLDWAKQFMHLIPCPRRRNDLSSGIQPFNKGWDSSLRGTSAHFLSNMDNSRYR